MLDLIIEGGRVIDPASGRDEIADIAFGGGRVASVGSGMPLRAEQIIEARGLLVVPGLIDLHTHVYWGGTSLGVDAAAVAQRSGTTTFVDAGSAGPGNFHGFRRHVIEPSPIPHPAVSERVVPRHLCLFRRGDGRRGGRSAAARPARMRPGDQRQSRLDRRRQGAGRPRRRRQLRGWRRSTWRSRSPRRSGCRSWRISTTRRRRASRCCRGCAAATSSPIASGRSRTRRSRPTGGSARRSWRRAAAASCSTSAMAAARSASAPPSACWRAASCPT